MDEAATGFLAVYHPTVLAIREKLPWLPLPVFRFETWIAGLAVAIVALSLWSVLVFRGGHRAWWAGWVFGSVMATNALAHTIGTLLGRTAASVHFPRPMPGFYSSPLLLAASMYLLLGLRSGEANRTNHGMRRPAS